MQRTLLGLALAAIVSFPSISDAQGFGRHVGVGYGAGYHSGYGANGGWGAWGGAGSYGWGSHHGGYGGCGCDSGCSSNCCDNVWAGYRSHGFGHGWGHGFGHGCGCGGYGGHIRNVGPGCCCCPSNDCCGSSSCGSSGCGCNGGNGYLDVTANAEMSESASESTQQPREAAAKAEEVEPAREEKENLNAPTENDPLLDLNNDSL